MSFYVAQMASAKLHQLQEQKQMTIDPSTYSTELQDLLSGKVKDVSELDFCPEFQGMMIGEELQMDLQRQSLESEQQRLDAELESVESAEEQQNNATGPIYGLG